MIDWQENYITEPSLCKKKTLADADVKNNIKLIISICRPPLPCHAQAFVRTLKLRTHINALLTNYCSKLPKFNTKKKCFVATAKHTIICIISYC